MQVTSVNVARIASRLIDGRRVRTAIGKQPAAGRVAVRRLGLDGDEQAETSLHGGPTKAVYAYPALHYPFWQTVRAQARVSLWDEALPAGAIGENLTISGVDETMLWVGDRLVLPGCVLAVTEPRLPCHKFGAAMGFAQAVPLMAQSGFCGAYLAVIEEGDVGAGDAVRLQPGPREVNVRELFRVRVGR